MTPKKHHIKASHVYFEQAIQGVYPLGSFLGEILTELFDKFVRSLMSLLFSRE